jgi:hypothetical protein
MLDALKEITGRSRRSGGRHSRVQELVRSCVQDATQGGSGEGGNTICTGQPCCQTSDRELKKDHPPGCKGFLSPAGRYCHGCNPGCTP